MNELQTSEHVSRLTGEATIAVETENTPRGVSHGRQQHRSEGAARTLAGKKPAAPVRGNARRPDDAIRELQEAIDLNPGLMLAHEQLAGAYLQKGMHAAAVTSQMQAALLGSVDDSTQLAYVLAATGDTTAARDILRRLLRTAPRRYIPPVGVAMAYAALANADSAFLWLDRGYALRAPFMDAIAIAPAFEPLHGDPRWTLLVRRLGFPQTRRSRPGEEHD